MHRAALDVQLHVVQCFQAAKLHQHVVGRQQVGTGLGRRGAGCHADGVAAQWRHLGFVEGLATRLQIQRRAHEADDAVLQVVNDEECDEAEDRQPPVGHRLQNEADAGQRNAAAHWNRRRLPVRLAALHRHRRADGYQHRDTHGHFAEQLQVVQQLGQQHDDGRTQHGAGACLAAAHDDGEQEGDGELEGVGVGADVLLAVRIQRTGQARQAGADDEGVDLVAVDADAHAVRRHRAAPQRLKSAAQMASENTVHEHQAQHQHHQHDPIELALVKLVAKQRRLVELDPQRSFGQECHLVDEDLDDGAEGQRDHRQIGARDAQRRQRQQGAEHSRDANRRQQHQHKGRR